MRKTTEFSFILKLSNHGIGVFATHDIKKETYLRLFREKNQIKVSILRKEKDVPEFFRQYCVYKSPDLLRCPKDFGRIELGWHINHSKKPNAYHRDFDYYALRDIKAGEEITVNYNTLEEPEETKDEYYRN